MKPDFYTKAVLTVIAVMLSVPALKPLISPATTASAQTSPFSGVQFAAYSNGGFTAFDTRSGDVWNYVGHGSGSVQYYGKLTQLGKPPVSGK